MERTYWLRASSDLSVPIANWPVIATNTFDGAGAFNLSAPIDSGTVQLFYVLQLQ